MLGSYVVDDSVTIRDLPSVREVIDTISDQNCLDIPSRKTMVNLVREVISELRHKIRNGSCARHALKPKAIAEEALSRARALIRGSLVPVINATGVILHTNLGRAPLEQTVLEHISRNLTWYTNLEYDLDSRSRASRHDHIASLLLKLITAEDCLVVNNNAAAILLVLSELASGRSVIVSRGELIEVGGGFRIPDVMRVSGARLVEVGTTNRTRLDDYENAITEDTALLFKAHRSNFRMEGFVEEVSWRDIANLARRRKLISVADLGSGLIETFQHPVLAGEPTVKHVLDAGLDIVCFSGDKLLGGPQAGIIAGKAHLIQRLKRNPLVRALRVGKFTIAALEATLSMYLSGRINELPVYQALFATKDEIRARCRRVLRLLSKLGTSGGTMYKVVPIRSEVGGGTLPGLYLESFAISVKRPGWTANDLDNALRHGSPPVLGRISEDSLLLDLRTLISGQEKDLAMALQRVDKLRTL